ncbi:MAG TPA: cyclic nucleotide-binding domain-containing protein [Rhizomicrobium sp.]|jgi:CRP/FNR family nitrogen fixation transcriptional regulator|nr:cyclic nucleotide-binding domain-containing protein [Rhizomicrobium sp.]
MSITLATASQSDRRAKCGRVAEADGMNEWVSFAQVLRTLQTSSVRKHYSRNEAIYLEGDAPEFVYKVLSGTVRLCRHTEDGRRHIADFVLEGDVFGVGDLTAHAFTAEAVSDVTLVAYPKGHLDRLIGDDINARNLLMEQLAADIAAARHHHFVLGCHNAKERVACFILRMARRLDVTAGHRVDLPMSRQDIADHLGLTIETVCRAISALKADGTLAVPNIHQLILRNINALNALSLAA